MAALSFASNHGKQEKMDLYCDWSHCDKTWQMSPKFEDCQWEGCPQSISTGEEESQPSSTDFVVFSQTFSCLSTVKCTSSASKRDGYVYKRRKLHRNSLALLPEENGNSDYHSRIISEDHHIHKAVTVPSSKIESVPNSVPSNISSVREDEVPAEVSIGDLHKSALEQCSSVIDRSSSLKSNMGHGSSLMKTGVEDAGECSSFNDVIKPLGEFTSVKELCISVLKSHGLLGGVWKCTQCPSLEIMCDNDSNLLQSCKICGLLENPSKMLICDLCEEAFHLSCCNLEGKKLPVDEWYCHPCFRKKPKTLRKNCTGKSFDIKGEIPGPRKKLSRGDLGPISLMLKAVQPYSSQVRIGKDFQAEVPDWSGPIHDNHECFGEPLEMDPAEFANQDGWTYNRPCKPSSIGNWIQCREVIDETHEGTICGKWRRAPLFVVQTDDWDCSCSVLWDPIHAHCAVPQELETEVVLEHLKYIEMLKARLADKQQ